jgi:pimeloyl-ACP methyl ester carboxylesterase
MNKLLTFIAAVSIAAAAFLAAQHQTFARVDAGGPKLRMLVTGRGNQTVVFEAGANGSLENWVRIQARISQFARTVSYDRAGNGLSDKGPVPRDGAHIAAELHAALHNAHLSPPYILVGHSLGGPFIRMFAAKYLNEVAGMVLVDPTQEDLIAWAREHDPEEHEETEHTPRPDNEVDCAPQTFAELKDTRLPNGIPVTLICGMGPREIPPFITQEMRREVEQDRTNLYPAKLQFHKAWVEKIPGGQLVVTEKSGHGIPFEEPELVVKAIRDVVARAANRSQTNP